LTFTAHHRADQVETVLHRLSRGSGWQGLAGIRPQHGFVRRPLLALEQSVLAAAVSDAGLVPALDPSNTDLAYERNRLRLLLLPALERHEPHLRDTAWRLAETAARATQVLDRVLERRLMPRRADHRVAVDWTRFRALPAPMVDPALWYLNRLAGARYPGTQGARRELKRQIAAGRGVGCDCGNGVRWFRRGTVLWVIDQAAGARFTYTPQVPLEHRLTGRTRHFPATPA
jgi:hypothetical protein